jgi:hypothetical protein
LAVRRIEIPRGKQAQAIWGNFGTVSDRDGERNLWGFAMTRGNSCGMMAGAAPEQKLATAAHV